MSKARSSLTKRELTQFIGQHFLVFRLPAESYTTLKEQEPPQYLFRTLRGCETRWLNEFITLFNLKLKNETEAPALTLHALCTGNETGHYVQRVPRIVWNTMSQDTQMQFSAANNTEMTEEALMARHDTIRSHAESANWKYSPPGRRFGPRAPRYHKRISSQCQTREDEAPSADVT